MVVYNEQSVSNFLSYTGLFELSLLILIFNLQILDLNSSNRILKNTEKKKCWYLIFCPLLTMFSIVYKKRHSFFVVFVEDSATMRSIQYF